MALNAYLRLTGETQGEMKGSVTQAGRQDSIEVIAYNHRIDSPRDAASGMATGKRKHSAITITKEIDKSTPLLANALYHNENITAWELQFWRPSRSGKEEQFFTIHLTNATVSEYRPSMLNNKLPENIRLPEFEHVSFAYQKIRFTWVDGAITAEDDWETPIF